MLDVAIGYRRRGWTPVPVVFRGKRPVGEAWQHRRITEETARQYFNGAGSGGYNIGLQLGAASGGLTDIDLDCREAIVIAPYVLPPTDSIFGRKSKRASHRFYVTDLCQQTDAAAFQLRDPRTKGILVELRIGGGTTGAQTVVPPSMHESGELVAWEVNGEAVRVDGDELARLVRLLGLASCWRDIGPPKTVTPATRRPWSSVAFCPVVGCDAACCGNTSARSQRQLAMRNTIPTAGRQQRTPRSPTAPARTLTVFQNS
jgi:hypothetical protein